MKASEFTPCLRCGRPVGDRGGLTFFQVTIERLIFDPEAVRTNMGLGMMTRSTRLMEALSPTPDIAKPLGEPEKFLLCDECAMADFPVAVLAELSADRRYSDAADAVATVELTAGGEVVTPVPAPAEGQAGNPAAGGGSGAQRPGRPLPVALATEDPPPGEAA